MVVSLCFGGHSVRETPGYIPNPEAKPYSADGTAGGTLWESRTPPNNLWKGPLVPSVHAGDQGSFHFSRAHRVPGCARMTCGTEDRSHPCPPTLPTTDRSAISGDGTLVTAVTAGGRDSAGTVVGSTATTAATTAEGTTAVDSVVGSAAT